MVQKLSNSVNKFVFELLSSAEFVFTKTPGYMLVILLVYINYMVIMSE